MTVRCLVMYFPFQTLSNTAYMSALAEMLQGKETLWRELSAAWDCSLPGAALVFGVTGAASGAGLGLKSGTYYCEAQGKGRAKGRPRKVT